MRFVNVNGVLQKARRFVSGAGSVQDEEVKSPQKLAELLRQMQKRISEIESVIPPEPIEFEVNVGSGGTITTISHNFNSAVRWYVVQWTQVGGTAYPVAAPRLVQDATSTSKVLALRSYTAGKAVVRVESAFADVDPGTTVVGYPDQYSLSLSSAYTNDTTGATSSLLAFPIAANEVWRIHFVGTCSVASGVAGMKFAVGGPAGATVEGWHYSTNNALTSRAFQRVNTINTLGAAVHTVAATVLDDQIIGVVKAGSTAGTVAIQGASGAAGVIATIGIKSSLFATKVTEV